MNNHDAYFAEMAVRNAKSLALAQEAAEAFMIFLMMQEMHKRGGGYFESVITQSPNGAAELAHAQKHLERVKEGKEPDTWPIPARPGTNTRSLNQTAAAPASL